MAKITNTLLFLIIISVLVFANTTQANAQTPISVKFDQDLHVINHGGLIVISNTDLAGGVLDTIAVTVESPSEIMTLEILESANNDGKFYSDYIKFADIDSGASNELDVAVNDVVTATYLGVSDTTTIKSASPGGQQYLDRVYDNNYATCPTDADSDGVCASWETTTALDINHPSGPPVYHYDCNPNCGDDMKDIFIEIDYMVGHRPNEIAIQEVVNAFLGAPVGDGIRLHVQIDDADSVNIPHSDCTRFPGTNTLDGFDQIKAKFFGTPDERSATDWATVGYKQKKQAFHYVLFVHSQCGALTSSGVAEVFGNDAMVSLGRFFMQVGSTDQQKGTLMHELGHNLKLHHGGAWNDQVNCKPNYLSVMSYSRQFADLVSDRDLNYSSKQLGAMPPGSGTSLDETSLNEGNGVESYMTDNPTEERITYGPTPPMILPSSGGRVNWNNADGDTETVSANINWLSSIGCDGTGQTLTGYDDWENINLNSRGTGNWADGRNVNIQGLPMGPNDQACEVFDSLPPQAQAQAHANRICADGASGITLEAVLEMRALRIVAINEYIQALPPEAFLDSGHVDDVKERYDKALTKIEIIARDDDPIAVNTELKKIDEELDSDFVEDEAKNISNGINDVMISNDMAATVPEFPITGLIILATAMSTILLMRVMPKAKLLK